MAIRLAMLAMFLCASAQGVELAGGEAAQVAILPYYSTGGPSSTGDVVTDTLNNNQTLVEVRNESFEQIKAVKLVFHEARNGRPTLSFNVYVPPAGLFSFALARIGNDPVLLTNDFACTVPSIVDGQNDGFLGDTTAFVRLRDDAYTGENADGGSTGPERKGEGFMIAYEMGAVDPEHPLAAAVLPGPDGIPVDCGATVEAFLPGGIWDEDIDEGILLSDGSINIKASLVNVSEGTRRVVPPTTLRDFSDTRLHRAPDELLMLSDVNPAVSQIVTPRGNVVVSSWENPVDAITALLIIERATVSLSTLSDLKASTDYIVALPTKPFYTDPAMVGDQPRAPFTQVFAAGNCETSFTQRVGRTGETADAGSDGLCNATNAFTAGVQSGVNSATGQRIAGAEVAEGTIVSLFDRDPGSKSVVRKNLLTSREGDTYIGLPVIAFSALRFTNGTLVDPTGGAVLSNYGVSDPMVAGRKIEIQLKNGKKETLQWIE